jgi:hypothetical protein
LTVAPAAASVTPAALGKMYGSADPTLTGTLSGFLPSDNVTATYARVAGETVGGSPYTISATLSPTSVLGNYTITYNTANFTISAAAATVTPNAASKTYGGADPTLTGTLTGFLGGDNVTATYARMAGETVGGSPYTISAALSPTSALSNYTITYGTAKFTITTAAATVTPNAASKVYGAADPTLTGTLTGFLSTDNVMASYARTAGQTVTGGPYTISATLSPATVLSNYTITYNTASFTINALAATVTPNAASKVYGAGDPAFTGTVTGFLPGDTVTALYARTPGQTVTGGPYTISATLSPASVLSNYNISYGTAPFAITPAAATVTPNAASKIYGAPDPTFTGTLTGFLSSDNVVATYARTAGTTVAGGPYTISATLSPMSVLSNYTITSTTATFSITRATPTMTWRAPAAISYGTALSGTQLDAQASVPGSLVYAPAAGTVLASGTQTLSVALTPTDTGDYTSASASVTLTVNVATASSLQSLVSSFSTDPQVAASLNATLALAAGAPNGASRAAHLNKFERDVNAQIGQSLTAAQAQVLLQVANTLY